MPKSVWTALTGFPRLRGLVSVTWGQQTFDERNRRMIFTRATLPVGTRAGKRYVRFAPASCVAAHILEWQDWYVDADLFSRERKNQFSRPKLVFAETAPRLRAAYDTQGIFLGRSLFTTTIRTPLNPVYLTGVLNSTLASFAFTMANGLTDSKPRRLTPANLAELPIVVPATDQERKLAGFVEGNVERLINVKQARRVISDVWHRLANFSARGYATFRQLLGTRLPGQKAIWVKRLLPSLTTLARRSRRFRNILVRGDETSPVLRLFGCTEKDELILLAEAEFAARELMLYAYLSASSVLSRCSRTLRRFLEEPIVPLPADEPALGADTVIAQLNTQAPKALRAEGIPFVTCDIARLDAELDELNAKIDAEVMALYGLNAEQAAAVLKWNRTPANECAQIETYLSRITSNLQETAGAAKPGKPENAPLLE